MVVRPKIDSNETGLAYAEEINGRPGVLPEIPEWYPLEPNEYDDFGGENTLLARRPINSSRQRKKGAITDLDASGGFNQDFTQTNTQRLLQGFMYADFREKPSTEIVSVSATGFATADAEGFTTGQLVFASGFVRDGNNGLHTVTGVDGNDVEVTGLQPEALNPADDYTLTVVGQSFTPSSLSVSIDDKFPAIVGMAGVDFTKFGLIPGEFVFVGGDEANSQFAQKVNNGFKRVYAVTVDKLYFDKSDMPMVADSGAGLGIRLFFGRVLKNELAGKQRRRTYHLERSLGVPDTDYPDQMQAEYITGAYPNEASINIENADKINIDLSFVAMRNHNRAASLGLMGGDRKSIPESDAYNTSTDFNAIKLAVYTGDDAAPEPLFAYATELKIDINNNISLNKAVSVLGGFDATIGLFEVSAELTVYFSTVEALAAVRNNDDVTLHIAVAKNNAGFVCDLPLIALGDARLEVELDEPITLPLACDAATAVKLNKNMDHTLLWCFFDYLPTLSEVNRV